MTSIATLIAASLVSAALSFALARMVYLAREGRVKVRLERVLRNRTQTDEMLAQARRQVDLLQHELDALRKMRSVTHRVHTTPRSDSEREREASIVVDGSGFADTQMRPLDLRH